MKSDYKCKWYNVCPMKIFYENGRIDSQWGEDYCYDVKDMKWKRMDCIILII